MLIFALFPLITQSNAHQHCKPAVSHLSLFYIALGKAEILQKCLLTIKLGLKSHENSNFKITHVQYKVPIVGLNFLGSRRQTAWYERFSSPRTHGPCAYFCYTPLSCKSRHIYLVTAMSPHSSLYRSRNIPPFLCSTRHRIFPLLQYSVRN